MVQQDLVSLTERTLFYVREGILTSREASARITRCLDGVDGVAPEVATALDSIARDLRDLRWGTGPEFAVAVDGIASRLNALGPPRAARA